MIIGGIGTGINYNTKSIGYNGNFNYGIYPRQDKSIQQLLKQAGVGLALLPYKADGITKGINSPLTNPWVDLSGNSNNALLTNFAGTTADGWDNQAIISSTGVDVDYENLVVNGDFSNGTTGWNPTGGTQAVVGGNLVVTGNGTSVSVYSITTLKTGQLAGERYFVRFRIRVTNSNATSLKIRTLDPIAQELLINSPVANQWYEITFISTISASPSGAYSVFAMATYPDTATANGKQLEIDYAMVMPITLNPYVQAIEARLGRQLSKEECDRIFPFVVAAGRSKVGIMPFLKFDGVNSYGILPNNPAIDIVGLDEFEITKCFMTGTTVNSGCLFAKELDGVTGTTQLSIATMVDGRIYFVFAGGSIFLGNVGTLVPNTLYLVKIRRKLGRMICYLNDVEIYNQPNTSNFVSRPNVTLGARSNIADGSTKNTFSNVFDGGTLITKNPQNWDALDKVTKIAFKGYY